MNLSEVNWDYNAAGSWPLQIKIIIILLICIVIAGGGVYQFTMPQIAAKEVLEKEELTLRDDFIDKQKKAVNLPAYEKQFKKIEALLDEMVKQMPSEAEVAGLLRKISKKAKESGLEIRLFETEAPERKDFYYELPSKIEVLGNYEDLGLFVSSLSTLDRIVTVHDVMIISPGKEKAKEDPRLEMKAIVRTYNEASEEDDDPEEATTGG